MELPSLGEQGYTPQGALCFHSEMCAGYMIYFYICSIYEYIEHIYISIYSIYIYIYLNQYLLGE